jgi:2-polyprenyl-3-methyl-5-hydroxy-6-metoxy-1,4-benzoquinol methylase
MSKCSCCQTEVEYQLFEEVLSSTGAPTTILICPNCSVLYNASAGIEKFTDKEISEFQATAVKNVYQASKVDQDNTTARIDACVPILSYLFQLNDLFLSREVCVEVGAGAGYLAAAAHQFFNKVFAIELDPEQVRNTFELMGFDTTRVFSTFEDFEATGERADCIILWHTLEHIPTPASFLKRLRNSMKANGILYLQIPLYRKANVFPAHYWFFNARALSILRESCGFTRQRFIFDRTNDFLAAIFE